MYDDFGFPDCDAFTTWANGAHLIESDSLWDVDFSKEGPFVARVYHGTTHDFKVFDLSRANCEGQYGKIHYFTSCRDDADRNYACIGPDLDIRISHETEKMTDWLGEDEDIAPEDVERIAKERVIEKLVGDTPQILDCIIKFANPYVVGAKNWRMKCLMPEVEDIEQEEDESDDDFEERLNHAQDEAQDQIYQRLTTAFFKAGRDLELHFTPNVPDILSLWEFDCLSEDFEDAFKNDDDMLDLTDDEGNNLVFAFRAQVIKHLGYDAIILLNADERFHTMGINPHTAHFHLFKATGETVKLVSSREFDKQNCDITA